jgi:RNA polymerase sigma factor (sigma-70 family)
MEVLRITDYRSCQLEDHLIVKRVVAGEKELFEILMRRHNEALFRVIRSYLKDSDEVQDAMQNTYLKAFDKLFQFQGNSAFSTWLIRIGINEALLRLRDIKKIRNLYSHSVELNSTIAQRIPDKQMTPESAMMRNEARRLLEHAIDELPEKYRVVYVLKEIQELPSADIAECLGITETNVKVRIHRAKTLLKDSLYKLSAPADVFEFGNKNCDAVVAFVMKRI